MTLRLRTAAHTDVGLVREGNEDSLYAGDRLIAIADGMGGAAAGEVASSATIHTLALLDADDSDTDPLGDLRTAVIAANDRIATMTSEHADLAGMGTTLTAMLWARQRLAIAQVGDSRAYLLRDGDMTQVTRDQTLVQMLVDDGRITAEQAASHPQRSVILNAINGEAGVEPELSVREVTVGDRYLLCSDGLSDYVAAPAIAEALAETDDPADACGRLVDLALAAGAPDNVSTIVADVVEDDDPDEGGAAVMAGAVTESPERAFDPADVTAVTTLGGATATPVPAEDSPEATQRPRRRPGRRTTGRQPRDSRSIGRRLVAVGLGVVVLVVVAVAATLVYVHHQWYVAASGSPVTAARTVSIYQGVQGSALGHPLSQLKSPTDIPVTALPESDRARLDGGIGVSGLAGARSAVTNLRSDACSDLPTAAPTPTPVRTSSATTHHRHLGTVAPTPVPIPTPTWCTQ